MLTASCAEVAAHSAQIAQLCEWSCGRLAAPNRRCGRCSMRGLGMKDDQGRPALEGRPKRCLIRPSFSPATKALAWDAPNRHTRPRLIDSAVDTDTNIARLQAPEFQLA